MQFRIIILSYTNNFINHHRNRYDIINHETVAIVFDFTIFALACNLYIDLIMKRTIFVNSNQARYTAASNLQN